MPKDRPLDATGIPSTYVPARNTVFLSLALAWAEVLGAPATIVIGVNAIDYSGYPDCRPEFIAAFERLAHARHRGRSDRRAASRSMRPSSRSSKADIIRKGLRSGSTMG